jgi:hypothetical protein
MISIVNGNSFGWIGLKNETWYKPGRTQVYAGRKNWTKRLPQSPLHNPYPMEWDEQKREYKLGERNRVDALFRQKLITELKSWQETQKASGLVAALLILTKAYRRQHKNVKKRQLQLVCHCNYPEQKCHCYWIAQAIYWLAQTGGKDEIDF